MSDTITVEALQKVKLERGDVVVIRLAESPTVETIEALSEHLKTSFPNNHAVVLDPGADLEVVTPTNDGGAAPQRDPA